MKKITALLLTFVMLLTLVACTGKADNDNNLFGDSEYSNEDSEYSDEGSESSDESNEAKFRLPENVKYTYMSPEGDYTNLTVTKIGDEFCIENNGEVTFYRKNADGQYDYWLRMGDGWMYMSAFDEMMFGMLLGISTANFDYDSVEKIGTDTVCGLSADVYQSKYLANNQTYIHSGKDGVFAVKTVAGSTVIEIVEWTTENVEFAVEKPE